MCEWMELLGLCNVNPCQHSTAARCSGNGEGSAPSPHVDDYRRAGCPEEGPTEEVGFSGACRPGSIEGGFLLGPLELVISCQNSGSHGH